MFQIAKLRSELEMVSGNVRVMSEMLTELVPTQAEPADLELLQVSRQLAAPRFSWGKPGNPPVRISPPAPLQFSQLMGTPWSQCERLKPGTLDSLPLELRALAFSGLNRIAPLASVSSSVGLFSFPPFRVQSLAGRRGSSSGFGRRRQLVSGPGAGGSCGFSLHVSHDIPTAPSPAGDHQRPYPTCGGQFLEVPRKVWDPKALESPGGSDLVFMVTAHK